MQKHIVVTGPESVGKTLLSRQLAEELGAIWIPEYARGYLLAAERKAIAEDFVHLVQANNHLVDAAFAQHRRKGTSTPIVVQDTGLEVLRIWQHDKFSPTAFVKAAWQAAKPDIYLLCHPDLPWEADPLREDPNRRQELFSTYQKVLATSGITVLEVSGFGESRRKNALKKLHPYLQ